MPANASKRNIKECRPDECDQYFVKGHYPLLATGDHLETGDSIDRPLGGKARVGGALEGDIICPAGQCR